MLKYSFFYQAGQKQTELEELKLKQIKDLWREDLDEFLVELEVCLELLYRIFLCKLKVLQYLYYCNK